MSASFVHRVTVLYAIVLHSIIVTVVLAQMFCRCVLHRPSGTFRRVLHGICSKYLLAMLRLGNYHLFTGDSSLTVFLKAHKLLASWTLQHMTALLVYMSANVICTFFGSSSLAEASLRAGRLAVVNAAVLYAGLHLGFLGDRVGVGVITYRRIHSVVSLIVLMLSAFHVVVAGLDRRNRRELASTHLFALLVRVRRHHSALESS